MSAPRKIRIATRESQLALASVLLELDENGEASRPPGRAEDDEETTEKVAD